MACNLRWGVPSDWARLSREIKIDRIKLELRMAMDAPDVDCSVIRNYLFQLESRTSQSCAHRLVTTNWDYLLQREILNMGFETLPKWLLSSHVSHLNGTIENLDSDYRSPFLLEEDLGSQRWATPEADIAYNEMLGAKCVVVVGMSFECETDRFLLAAMHRAEDDVPLGEALVIVLNLDQAALDKVSKRIKASLPRAKIWPVRQSFEAWVDEGMPELRAAGFLN